jgi:hypothetical protein
MTVQMFSVIMALVCTTEGQLTLPSLGYTDQNLARRSSASTLSFANVGLRANKTLLRIRDFLSEFGSNSSRNTPALRCPLGGAEGGFLVRNGACTIWA